MSSTDLVTGKGSLVTLARGIVWVFLVGAVLLALLGLVFGITSLVEQYSSGRIALSLIADAPLPREADAGTARLESGSYETASAVVSGLSGGVVALALTSAIAGVLTSAALAASVVAVAWTLLRRSTFRRPLSLTMTFAGAVLLVGGLLSTGTGALAAMMAADELNASTGRGFWPLAGQVDFAPIGIGVVLLLVALVFGYGERLQRDTDGLV